MRTTSDIARTYGLSERQVRHLAALHNLGRVEERPDGRGPMRVFDDGDARWFERRPGRGRPVREG